MTSKTPDTLLSGATEASRQSSTADTKAAVRAHLRAFLEQRGVDAVVADYDQAAVFYTEEAVYRGRKAIHEFFTGFFAALPAGAIDNFTLKAFWVDGNVAFITWNVGDDIPLGTDTFVVEGNKIVAQSFAMHLATREA